MVTAAAVGDLKRQLRGADLSTIKQIDGWARRARRAMIFAHGHPGFLRLPEGGFRDLFRHRMSGARRAQGALYQNS